MTGKGDTKKDRNVGKKANVTAEQLKAAGLTGGPKGLRTYLNMFDKLGRRPKPSDFKKAAPKKAAPSGRSFDPTKPNQGGPGMAGIKPPKGPMSPMAAAAKMGAKGEDEMPKFARGGMMKSKMKAKGMKAGGKMTSKMKAKGMKAGGKMKAKGMAKGGMKTKGYMAGGLKDAPESNTGLKKLPKQVRNKMGFKAKGGMMKTKGYAKGGKVRGAGIARKGVRPAKMR